MSDHGIPRDVRRAIMSRKVALMSSGTHDALNGRRLKMREGM